ncbi:MAG: enoyl-CoA hydratase/isomerase family protein [Promethearchaeota archaeon]
MKHELVEKEYLDDGLILILKLNRPRALNALNKQLAAEFTEALNEAEQDEKLRAIIITGNGKAFCAGGDLAAFKSSEDPATFLKELATKFHEGIKKIRYLDVPVIAAINGPCFGVGLSLACACDFRIANSNAKFSVAFTGVGLSPDSSLPYFLPKIVGLGVATELALLNKTIDADQALSIHLVSAISGNAVDKAMELAKTLSRMPTKAIGMVKKLYNVAFSDSLEQHLEKEVEAIGITANTRDFLEGCNAFFEKRPPCFEGK